MSQTIRTMADSELRLAKKVVLEDGSVKLLVMTPDIREKGYINIKVLGDDDIVDYERGGVTCWRDRKYVAKEISDKLEVLIDIYRRDEERKKTSRI